MYDLKLIESGEEFELLCEDLLKAKGLDVQSKPSRGPDGGADMIVGITVTDGLGFRQESRILVECKHFAHSGRSVRESDVGSIIERTIRHNCNKYLLITSTLPSASVSQQLQAISQNPSINILAAVWASNDLQGFLTQCPVVVSKYFAPKEKTQYIETEPRLPKHVIGIHLHPDFANEIKETIEVWNSCQSMYSFVPLKPPRKFESVLLKPSPISCSEAELLASQIIKAAGFEKNDGLIQFCEGRLHEEPYYQLFSWTTSFGNGYLEQSTISLYMKRKLATVVSLEAPVYSMIIQSILYAIGCAIDLDAHDVTRGCIMDFNNEMEDILVGLDYGPKFCPHCAKLINDGGHNFLQSLSDVSRNIIYKSKDTSKMPIRMKLREERQKQFGPNHYDVALSFAGEDRTRAERLATELRNRGVTIFYDAFEKSALWGKDLYSYLDDLYRFRATFCVVFISEQYAKKLWTNHERKSAQAKAFSENRVYILPIKIDETDVPGISPTVGYLSWDDESIESIADLIQRKLEKNKK